MIMDRLSLLTDGTVIEDYNTEYYHLRANVTFFNKAAGIIIPAGTIGGWMDKDTFESSMVNKPEESTWWIGDNARVSKSLLIGDVAILNEATVEGSQLWHKAMVLNNAKIVDSYMTDCAVVSGNAYIDRAGIYDNAQVRDNAKVEIYSRLYNNAFISGTSRIIRTWLFDNCIVCGKSDISNENWFVLDGKYVEIHGDSYMKDFHYRVNDNEEHVFDRIRFEPILNIHFL